MQITSTEVQTVLPSIHLTLKVTSLLDASEAHHVHREVGRLGTPGMWTDLPGLITGFTLVSFLSLTADQAMTEIRSTLLRNHIPIVHVKRESWVFVAPT
jgi:hypothetical protein